MYQRCLIFHSNFMLSNVPVNIHRIINITTAYIIKEENVKNYIYIIKNEIKRIFFVFACNVISNKLHQNTFVIQIAADVDTLIHIFNKIKNLILEDVSEQKVSHSQFKNKIKKEGSLNQYEYTFVHNRSIYKPIFLIGSKNKMGRPKTKLIAMLFILKLK